MSAYVLTFAGCLNVQLFNCLRNTKEQLIEKPTKVMHLQY